MSDKIYLLFACVDTADPWMGLGELAGAFGSIEAAMEGYKNGFGIEDSQRRFGYDDGEIYDYDTLESVWTIYEGEWVLVSNIQGFRKDRPAYMDQLAVLLERRKLSQAIGDGAVSVRGNGGRL